MNGVTIPYPSVIHHHELKVDDAGKWLSVSLPKGSVILQPRAKFDHHPYVYFARPVEDVEMEDRYFMLAETGAKINDCPGNESHANWEILYHGTIKTFGDTKVYHLLERVPALEVGGN